MTLYEFSEEYIELLEKAENSAVTEEDLKFALDALADGVKDKAAGYAKVMKEIETQSAAVDAEIKRLQARKKLLDGNEEQMRESLKNTMLMMGIEKINTNLFDISVKKGGTSVKIDVEADIPDQFWVPQKPRIDKKALKTHLTEKEEPYAHLENGYSLSIQ